MPITLYTGNPRNGKTALMMEHLMRVAKEGVRPLYAAGIDGLKPGYATVLDDPRRWNDLAEGEGTCTCHMKATPHEHLVPRGSIVFVDEAWKWFGHLHNATNQATPPHVLAMAEHGHRELDFVFTTQLPNQLYPFMRGLIADHYHVVRRFWTRMIDVFHWAELNEEVKSQSKRENAERTTRALPEKTFTEYKSAEGHENIKARIPWKVWLLPICVIAFAVLAWYGYNTLRPSAMAQRLSGKGQDDAIAAAAPASPDARNAAAAPRWKSLTEYAEAHMPRFASMPWTAPVFDERRATADPQLFCMYSDEGVDANGEWKDESCSCLTEQGTDYTMGQAECKTVALKGVPYNPYKERMRQAASERGDHESPSMDALASAPAQDAASFIPSPADNRGVQQYGTFQSEPPSADPAYSGGQ